MNDTYAPARTPRALLAILLSLLLVVAGAITAPVATAAEAPTVSVDAVSRDGGAVTVSGSGFAGAKPGIYVGVGPAGLPGFYRASSSLFEVVYVAVGNVSGGSDQGRTEPMAEDGSFSFTVTVPAYTDGAEYAVYTSKAHGQGMADPSQDTTTVLPWAAAPEPEPTETPTPEPTPTEAPSPEPTPTDTPTPEPTATSTPTPEPTPTDTPTPVEAAVTTSHTTLMTGDEFTVSGTGFSPNAPATDGTRPPLRGAFGGAYVQFGYYSGEKWTAARTADVTKWVVAAQDVETIGGAAAGAVALSDDGSFSTTLVAQKPSDAPADARFGVRTFSGSGASYAPFSTFTPLTILDAPALTVDATQGVSDGQQLAVSGTGFSPNAPATDGTRPPLRGAFGGAYVQFGYYSGEKWIAARTPEVTKWVVAAQDVDTIGGAAAGAVALSDDGSFSTTLVAQKPADAPADARFGVRTFSGSGANYAPFSTFTEITFSAAPAVVVSETTGVADGATLSVAGTGFSPNAPATDGTRPPLRGTFGGAYVQFGYYSGEKWTAARTPEVTKWVVAADDVATIGGAAAGGVALADDGSFATTLVAQKAADAPADARFGVRTFSGSGANYAPFSTFTEVTFSAVPAVDVSQTTDVADGATLTISGTGFSPNAPATDGTRPPLRGTFGGAYVQFGYYEGTSWKAARTTDATKWVVAAQDVDTIGGAAAGAVALSDDGSFSTTLVAQKPADAPADARFGVRTFSGSGANYAPFSTFTELTFAAPSVRALEVSVPTVTAESAKVRVVGSQFGDITGAYAAVIEKGTEAGLSADGGYVVFGYWMTPGAIMGGAFDKTLDAPADKLDRTKQYEVLVWQGHTEPKADTIYARADVSFTPAQWDVIDPSTTPTPRPTPTPTPTPTGPLSPNVPIVAGGSLSWAISSSFADYIVGPIAKGTIAVSGGATQSGGQFQFGQAAGSTYDAARGTGTVDYVGSVRFTGHGGILDVTVANPQVNVTSPSAATLFVTSGGQRVAFATLDLASASKTSANGAVTYSAAPAALTADGREIVLGGYSTTLSPVTFTIGSAAEAPSGSTGTIATASTTSTTRITLPDAPPATSGVVVTADQLALLAAGKTATVSASGFAPNETGIRVVVYSTPVLLGTVDANADGVASWTGSLPATLGDGEHTLTFQGSVDRGVVFSLKRVAAAIAAAGTCAVADATLEWGFKESFRSYIEGIAQGGWTLEGVSYSYPQFVWTPGAGGLDLAAKTGLITFGGSLRFTGHGGALDTTLSAGRIELAGKVGYLVFDISGTTQDGATVAAQNVRFAEFALGDLTVTNGAIVLDALPATLTEAGAAAFGTYPAGTDLDPVSATIPVAEGCGVASAPEKAEAISAPVEADVEAPAAEEAPVWPWVLGGGLLVIAAAVVAGVLISRRRRADEIAEEGVDSATR